jgi:hypothetical protein
MNVLSGDIPLKETAFKLLQCCLNNFFYKPVSFSSNSTTYALHDLISKKRCSGYYCSVSNHAPVI